MSIEHDKGWYLLRRGEPSIINHVCRASDTSSAREIFGALAEGHDVVVLTWGQLDALLGCITPDYAEPDNFADAGIAFKHEGQFITIWPDGD